MNSAVQDHKIYAFDDFVIDEHERELRRAGILISLQPKTFDTLLYLVEHAGHLARRDEMLDALWPNSVVSENSLARTIKEVRRALDEPADAPHYLHTVRGTGYRFIGEVSNKAPEEHAQPMETPGIGRLVMLLAATAAGMLLLAAMWLRYDTPGSPPANSLAVLAFENLTGDPAQTAFCDGLSEELLHHMASVPGLAVTARTSAFSFKGQKLDVPTIAKRLGVTHILEGSVRSDANQLRITAQLVNADGFHLWSGVYDHNADDIFAVQDDIALAVTEQMQISLLDSRTRLAGQHGTDDADAYREFLLGVGHFRAYTNDGRDLAVAAFERAIRIDPEFAAPHAYMAMALLPRGTMATDSEMMRAEDLANRALELDPELAAGYAALGRIEIERVESDITRREVLISHLKRALELDPSFADARNWYSTTLSSQGKIDEAYAQKLQGVLTDPLHPALRANLAIMLMTLGRTEEAEAHLRYVISLPHPPEYVHGLLIFHELNSGRLSAALRQAVTIAERYPDNPGWRTRVAELLARLGLNDDASAWASSAGEVKPLNYLYAAGDEVALAQHITELVKQLSGVPVSRWPMESTFLVAREYARVGDSESSIALLTQRITSTANVTGWRGDFEFPAELAQYLAHAWVTRKEYALANELLDAIDRETTLRRQHGVTGYWPLTGIEARNAALRGDVQVAITLLQQAISEGYRDNNTLRRDPRWDKVRDDQRFIALLDFIDQDLAQMRADVLADKSLVAALARVPAVARVTDVEN